MNRKVIISIVAILTFVALRYLKYFYRYCIFGNDKWIAMDFNLLVSILNYSQIVIVLIVTTLLFKKSPFKYLGMTTEFWNGLICAFICTIPMFLGYGYVVNFHSEITLADIHMDAVLAGFFEEFMFRGFIFGLLFYYAGWGFISAVLIPSIFFGIGHLYQAETMSQGISVFLFTALGGAGFAWFYVAWRSIWMVVFLHAFMDIAWHMFSIQSNVTGNLYANIFRFTTLGLAIYFSVRKAKSENRYSLKGKLWVNSEVLT